MRACGFNEMADKLHSLFEIGKVIIIDMCTYVHNGMCC